MISNAGKLKGPMIYLATEVLAKLTPLVCIPFLTEALSLAEYGKLQLYITTIPVMAIILSFSQGASVKREYIDNKARSLRALYNIVLYATGLAVVLFIIHLSSGYGFIGKEYLWYIIPGSLFFAITELYNSYLLISRQVIIYNIIYLVRTSLPYVIGLLLIYQLDEVSVNYARAHVLVMAVLTILITIKVLQLSDRKWDPKLLKSSIRFALPIIPGSISALVLTFADRYLIEYYTGLEEVAIYSMGYTIAAILSMAFLAIGKAWQPFMLEELKTGKVIRLRKVARLYFLVILVMAVGIYFARHFILDILADESYADAAEIVPYILGGLIFYFIYTLYSNIAFYLRRTIILVIPGIAAAILNIILNIILIPKHGYEVAALTTLISYGLQGLLTVILANAIFGIDILIFNTKGDIGRTS